jgi:hypothetical protein
VIKAQVEQLRSFLRFAVKRLINCLVGLMEQSVGVEKKVTQQGSILIEYRFD